MRNCFIIPTHSSATLSYINTTDCIDACLLRLLKIREGSKVAFGHLLITWWQKVYLASFEAVPCVG